MERATRENPPEQLPRSYEAPKYESIKDLRLLSKAFREGWATGIPVARKNELIGYVCDAMQDPKKFNAAARTWLAISAHISRAKLARFEEILNAFKRTSGQRRENPDCEPR